MWDQKTRYFGFVSFWNQQRFNQEDKHNHQSEYNCNHQSKRNCNDQSKRKRTLYHDLNFEAIVRISWL
ncbi:oligouridylate-binding protein 1-like [Iris pallida]|uniref:Oligouridylate-binding protein 1-like n=1 Tax=Iris pallida TaxID=29817 RepID=A0AAX6HW00_IRIPA|nr:oligouridylate-binding protein 1-like [Iris pallida]